MLLNFSFPGRSLTAPARPLPARTAPASQMLPPRCCDTADTPPRTGSLWLPMATPSSFNSSLWLPRSPQIRPWDSYHAAHTRRESRPPLVITAAFRVTYYHYLHFLDERAQVEAAFKPKHQYPGPKFCFPTWSSQIPDQPEYIAYTALLMGNALSSHHQTVKAGLSTAHLHVPPPPGSFPSLRCLTSSTCYSTHGRLPEDKVPIYLCGCQTRENTYSAFIRYLKSVYVLPSNWQVTREQGEDPPFPQTPWPSQAQQWVESSPWIIRAGRPQAKPHQRRTAVSPFSLLRGPIHRSSSPGPRLFSHAGI